jgi:hypothetical protein
MSRLTYVKRHPRRTLGALASVLVAVGVAIGSGATFSASASNPVNTFTAGTMGLTDSQSGAILTATGMLPGGTLQSGTVDIQGTGADASSLTVSESTPVDKDGAGVTCDTNNVCASPYSGKVNLWIYDCGTFTGSTPPTCPSDSTIAAADPGTDTNLKYKGTLAGFTSPVSLGSLPAGTQHRYQFVTQLDSSADSTYKSESSQVDFNWSSAQ